jgi:hypothetical protein
MNIERRRNKINNIIYYQKLLDWLNSKIICKIPLTEKEIKQHEILYNWWLKEYPESYGIGY